MKIAIYGGAFNPVHKGHIEIVKQINEKYKFDKILVIPSKFSPHKSNKELASDEHRLNMCRLAFNGLDNCEVSDIEIKRNKISFTVDTLTELKNVYPFDDFYLVCGSDMFLSLLKWRNPEEIFKMTSILAFRRDDESIEVMNDYKEVLTSMGVNVLICEMKIPPFSSTKVRDAIKSNKPYDKFVTENVYDYILKNRLYC